MKLNVLPLVVLLSLLYRTSVSIVSAPPGPSGTAGCSNNARRCVYWAQTGECQKNPTYMLTNCSGACTGCPQQTFVPTCQDLDQQGKCAGWVQSGECQKNLPYMIWQCQKSCSFCGTVAIPGSSQSAAGAQPQTAPIAPAASATGTAAAAAVTSGAAVVQTTIAASATGTPLMTVANVAVTSAAPAAAASAAPVAAAPAAPVAAALGTASTGSCNNNLRRCVFWAQTGECQKNPTFMQKNCVGACAGCAQQTFIEQCVDLNQGKCAGWVQSGECQKNFPYMIWQCQKSCNFCGAVTVPAQKGSGAVQSPATSLQSTGPLAAGSAIPEPTPNRGSASSGVGSLGTGPVASGGNSSCSNNLRRCVFWAQSGECQKNAQWMMKNCAGACAKCPTQTFTQPCQDLNNNQCAKWSQSGECQKNMPYMLW